MAEASRRRSARLAAADAAQPREALRKKNFRLLQSEIDRAMEILGTRSETETIQQALQMITLRDRLAHGVRNMRGAGLVDVFEDER